MAASSAAPLKSDSSPPAEAAALAAAVPSGLPRLRVDEVPK